MDHKQLTERIKRFEDSYENGRPYGVKWREIWDEIKAISAAFRGVRYPNRQEHQESWDRFQSAVQHVKEKQAEEREQNEAKSKVSDEHKWNIKALADAATPPCGLADAIFSLFAFPAQAIADLLTALLPGGPIDQKKGELQYYSSKLAEGWDYLKAHKEEMFKKDKDDAFGSLKRAQEQLNDAWEQWKRGKADLLDKRNSERDRKRDDWEQKHEAWTSRMRENIANLEERRAKLEGALEHRKDRRSDLDDKLSDARGDDFRSVVRGWIDENEESIRQIEIKLDKVNDWIREAYDKIIK